MTPTNPLPTGWNDVDDEPVMVRTGQTNVSPVFERTKNKSSMPADQNRGEGPGLWQLRFSAITGVSFVLVAVVFYVGVNNIRGSLTGGTSAVTVTITADGHFSPKNIDVVAGQVLTIENQNTDPQVLKISSGLELFPTQVIFTEPYSFTIPSGTTGVFTYVSETLPSDEKLQITVTTPMEMSGADSSSVSEDIIPLPFGDTSSSSVPTSLDIPLPFDGLPSSSPVSTSSSATSVSSSQNSTSMTYSTETPTISLGGSSGGGGGGGGGGISSVSTEHQAPRTIETNPYTVAWVRDHPNEQARNPLQPSGTEKLHSGAPLETYRPKSVTKTGPEVWMLTVPALLLMLLAYRSRAFRY